MYAAAYLRYFQDRWRSSYPGIKQDVSILATLYNQGEVKKPHSNPVPNHFGKMAKENYQLVKEVLTNKCKGDKNGKKSGSRKKDQ